jgi:phosphoribosylformylglycinamidine cyclo-ligase
MKKQVMTYKNAGVDINEADKFVAMIKSRIAATWPEMAKEIGEFAGQAKIPTIRGNMARSLYASTDGVGTKLKIAALLDEYSGIGQDAFAMSAVDSYVAGSRPMFLLDYFATGKLIADKHIAIMDSLIEACRSADCRIVGGETAELPGMFKYDWLIDLVTFVIGFPDPILEFKPKKVGQKVYGWPSYGPASNGYSLLRKIFGLNDSPSKVRKKLNRYYPELHGIHETLGQALLAPTRVWITAIDMAIMVGTKFSGHAHITGGGLIENPPRILDEGLKMVIDRSSWKRPAIFGLAQRIGKVPIEDMDRTFNNGIMVVSVVSDEGRPISRSSSAIEIGVIEKRKEGEKPVILTGKYKD